MDQEYTDEAIGKKILELNSAGVAFDAIKKVLDNINRSFQYVQRFMQLSVPKLVKNMRYIADEKPIWPPTIKLGKTSMVFGIISINSTIISLIMKIYSFLPPGPLFYVPIINILAYLGLGIGIGAIIMGIYFMSQKMSSVGLIGLILGGITVFIFIALNFIVI